MKSHLILAAMGLMAAFATTALAGAGAPYAARDPAVCAPLTQKGPPNTAQAAKLVTCDQEKDYGNQLFLVADMMVQVAPAGRRYNPSQDNGDQIDITKPVYDIRGSFTRYACAKPDTAFSKAGHNCNSSNESAAKGICYADTFGSWRCTMHDVMHMTYSAFHVPPPR